MRYFISFLLIMNFVKSYSQVNDVDNKYLEDQFYLGLYYTLFD